MKDEQRRMASEGWNDEFSRSPILAFARFHSRTFSFSHVRSFSLCQDLTLVRPPVLAFALSHFRTFSRVHGFRVVFSRRLNCPQAASISRPRLRRKWVFTYLLQSASMNAWAAASAGRR
jgi:hypothetical protein